MKSKLFFLLLTYLWAATSFAKDISIPFYSETLPIAYSPAILTDFKVAVDELSIINYYRHLESLDFQSLLESLDDQREHLQLNDWLFYELLYLTLYHIYDKKADLKTNLICWYLLRQEGFDARLAYQKDKVYVYVYTNDELFEVPMIREDDRTFVNLTNIYNQKTITTALHLLPFPQETVGKSFNFYLEQIPSLKPQKKNKQVQFHYNKTTYRMKVKIDETVIDFMQRYPVLKENEYMEVPLSTTLAGSLLPKLKHMLKGKTEKEALQLLVAFTRSSFQYKEDESQFGVAKPMIAEEVFFYPYSDCEDRSALFYVLVKELLDLPMVIVAFEDHLTIGVAIPQFEGDSIRFNGTNYYICDPTGPINTAVVGIFPHEYQNKPFEIIGHYQ